jgi:hypothetical protein
MLNLELSISSLSSLDTVAAEAKKKNLTGVDISSWQQNVQMKIDTIQKFSAFI